jgi:hypothetical protein
VREDQWPFVDSDGSLATSFLCQINSAAHPLLRHLTFSSSGVERSIVRTIQMEP